MEEGELGEAGGEKVRGDGVEGESLAGGVSAAGGAGGEGLP